MCSGLLSFEVLDFDCSENVCTDTSQFQSKLHKTHTHTWTSVFVEQQVQTSVAKLCSSLRFPKCNLPKKNFKILMFKPSDTSVLEQVPCDNFPLRNKRNLLKNSAQRSWSCPEISDPWFTKRTWKTKCFFYYQYSLSTHSIDWN